MLCVSRLSRLARFGGAVLFAALAATAAQAVPTWQIIAVQVQPGGAPTLLAAFDELMASEVGQTLPGRIQDGKLSMRPMEGMPFDITLNRK